MRRIATLVPWVVRHQQAVLTPQEQEALAPDANWESPRLRLPLVLLGVLCLALSACSAPVGAVRVDRTEAYRDLTRSVVTTGELSWPTRDVLFERGLFETFGERPEAAIAELHRVMVAEGGDPGLLFALAELSFLHGEAAAKPDHRMAAAIYAYAFLFPEDGGPPLGPFDPRFRVAADLYNWSLTAAFASQDGGGGRPARRHVRAALRADRRGVRSRRAARRKPRAVSVHPGGRARGARLGDALSPAGHRSSARGLHPIDRGRGHRR
jgi:hypothetical protein